MNPLTNVKNIQKLNKLELESGVSGKTSWHNQYKDSAWVFIGGLPYDLTEGDILAVFSQYGEIVNVNLVRDKASGKSKGFVFLCYEDQRSTILAVDNLNSTKILGRTLRVDHCENYRKPKETGEEDDLTQQLRAHGCAPKTPSPIPSEDEDIIPVKKAKKDKGGKKKKEKKKKKDKKEKFIKTEIKSENSDSGDEQLQRSHDLSPPIRVKQEKLDPGYDKYATIDRNRKIKQEKEDGTDSRRKNARNPREDHSRATEGERRTERQDWGMLDRSRSPNRDLPRERFQQERTKFSHDDNNYRSEQGNFAAKGSRQKDSKRFQSNFRQPRESELRSRSASENPVRKADSYYEERQERDHRHDRHSDYRTHRHDNYDDRRRR